MLDWVRVSILLPDVQEFQTKYFGEVSLRHLVEALVRWVIRHFVWFAAIVAILTAGKLLLAEFREFQSLTNQSENLKRDKTAIVESVTVLTKQTSDRAASLKKASIEKLKSRIDEIDKDIQQNESKQKDLVKFPSLAEVPGGNGFVEHRKRAIEIILLKQELAHLSALLSIATSRLGFERSRAELEDRRKSHVAAYRRLRESEDKQAFLRREHPIAIKIPGTRIYELLQGLLKSHKDLVDTNQMAYESYDRQRKLVEALRILKDPPPFVIQEDQVKDAMRSLSNAISDREKNLLQNWVRRASAPIFDVFHVAALILLSIILTPIAIKAIFYWILAPLASKRPPLCLLPGVSGTILGENGCANRWAEDTKASSVSLTLTIDESQEVLIHPEYLQSSTVAGPKDTKWLLDWKFPLTSLASGLVALTRIRTNGSESVVISATKDPFSEVGVINLPGGSAVALQPHNLVGIVHRKDARVQITKHWRLGSLHAWLTLQLRYLVFHGPVQLIVKGCRGIRVEKAGAGRRINRAATIGFSANLDYSTMRCETFSAYLMGKQELLNDSFAGAPGFYVYEEMPHFGKKTGIAGRGLEGLTDSVLKVFGV